MAKAYTVIKTTEELAKSLGLNEDEARIMEKKIELIVKIKKIMKSNGITQEELAKLVETSRPRITSILNINTRKVSIDFLMKVLYKLGYVTNFTLKRA